VVIVADPYCRILGFLDRSPWLRRLVAGFPPLRPGSSHVGFVLDKEALWHCYTLIFIRSWWNDWQGKQKYSEKTCPSVSLFTTNPTWPNLASNPGSRGGKPATNRLSYGTAKFWGSIWIRALQLPSKSFASHSQISLPLNARYTTYWHCPKMALPKGMMNWETLGKKRTRRTTPAFARRGWGNYEKLRWRISLFGLKSVLARPQHKSEALPVEPPGSVSYPCKRPSSETVRFPHFLHSGPTDGGEVVSLTRRPPFTAWY
jgi:hypothetical protein